MDQQEQEIICNCQVFTKGQFGKFEWWDSLETRMNNQSMITQRPMSIEGAKIIRVNHKTFTVRDATGIKYVVPMNTAKFTPMEPIKTA